MPQALFSFSSSAIPSTPSKITFMYGAANTTSSGCPPFLFVVTPVVTRPSWRLPCPGKGRESFTRMVSFAAASAMMMGGHTGTGLLDDAELDITSAEDVGTSFPNAYTMGDPNPHSTQSLSAFLQRKIIQRVPGFDSDSVSLESQSSRTSFNHSDLSQSSDETRTTSTIWCSFDALKTKVYESATSSPYTAALSPPPWHRKRRLAPLPILNESELCPIHRCLPCGPCDRKRAGEDASPLFDL